MSGAAKTGRKSTVARKVVARVTAFKTRKSLSVESADSGRSATQGEEEASILLNKHHILRYSIDEYRKAKRSFVVAGSVAAVNPYRVLDLRDFKQRTSLEAIEKSSVAKTDALLSALFDKHFVDPATQNLLDRIEAAVKILGAGSKEKYDAEIARKSDNREWCVLRYKNALYEGEVNKETLALYENGGDCLLRHGSGVTITRDGGRYEGKYKHDARHGFGWYFLPQGDVYFGGWNNDLMDGVGEYFYKDGSWYVGNFKEGKRNGDGHMFWHAGSTYCGQWLDGVFDGNGTLTREDKKSYKGQWLRGHEHGAGVYIDAEGKNVVRYEGEFSNRVPHGKAIVLFANGDEYRGDMVDGFKTCAAAKYTWANERNYVGSLEKERPRVGKLRDLKEQKVYDGQWKKCVTHGDGKLSDKSAEFSYSGQWKEGKMHGTGTCEWTSSGNSYSGEFDSNMKQGTGIYSWDTATWEGQFQSDARHGMGVYLQAEGKHKIECFERYFLGHICNRDGHLCRPHLPDDAKSVRKSRKSIPV